MRFFLNQHILVDVLLDNVDCARCPIRRVAAVTGLVGLACCDFVFVICEKAMSEDLLFGTITSVRNTGAVVMLVSLRSNYFSDLVGACVNDVHIPDASYRNEHRLT